MNPLHSIGKIIIPKKINIHLKKYIQKTGAYNVPYTLYGLLFLLTLISTSACIAYFLFPWLSASPIFLAIGIPLAFVILEILSILGLFLIFWLYYEFKIFKRTREIEEVLPDFLQEVSISLKAGMTFDKALWNSLQPEYVVLDKEIEIVAKKVMGGDDTENALKEFADKYDSTLLQESMDMIIVGIRSGGDVADLIERIVENVKDASYVRKQLIASVTSYIIFISITAIILSPMLFALSFNLMELIQELTSKIASNATDLVGFSISGDSIKPEDFILFSKICVLIIASISSMIVADLREGSIKAGIKYIVIFSPISYVVYTTMLKVMTSLFGVLV